MTGHTPISGGTSTADRATVAGRRSALKSGTGAAFHLVSGLKLAPLPTAISCARLHAVAVLHEWGLRDLSDNAALIVSELATNAVAASAVLDSRPPIALRLSVGHGRVLIEVWDSSPADVVTSTADDDSESGRGLVIVDAVADRWGQSRRGVNRKVVWAVLAL